MYHSVENSVEGAVVVVRERRVRGAEWEGIGDIGGEGCVKA